MKNPKPPTDAERLASAFRLLRQAQLFIYPDNKLYQDIEVLLHTDPAYVRPNSQAYHEPNPFRQL